MSFGLSVTAARAEAQWRPAPAPLPLLDSEAERQARLEALRDPDARRHTMLRSTASALEELDVPTRPRIATRWFVPELATSYNSAHAWGFNDGELRAGRGANLLLSTGAALRIGRVRAMLLPQMVHEANLDFQTIPFPQYAPPTRDVWANPFYVLPNSADYPQRFGDRSRTSAVVQGRVSVDLLPGLRVGVGNEQRRWGPGVQNSLLLSANAPPFRQAFIEADAPLRTPLGHVDYQVILGELRDSEYFLAQGPGPTRSLSAVAISWMPSGPLAILPTMGIARGVMARRSPGIATALDAFRNVGRPWTRLADTATAREQITTLFLRWHVPAEGVDLYAEWARFEQPASLRDFLQQPGHAQGYTLGGQWARPWRQGLLHLRSEFTYLEPSTSVRVRPVNTSYTGSSVPQGWTHRGQMLGPGIGPGASSQWAAADFYGRDWRWGGTLGRWRRDANYRFLQPLPLKREDLQLYAALRAGRRLRGLDVLVELTNGVRLNHLYQAYLLPGSSGNDTEGVDLLNRTLAVTLTPHVMRRP